MIKSRWFKELHAKTSEQKPLHTDVEKNHSNLGTESYREFLLNRLTYFKQIEYQFYYLHVFSSFIKYLLKSTDTKVQHPTDSTTLMEFTF